MLCGVLRSTPRGCESYPQAFAARCSGLPRVSGLTPLTRGRLQRAALPCPKRGGVAGLQYGREGSAPSVCKEGEDLKGGRTIFSQPMILIQ